MNSPAPMLTIDGPSGVGKGAVAARVARRLEWNTLDSGAVYRVVAMFALDRGLEPADEAGLVDLCGNLPVSFIPDDDGIAVLIDGEPAGERLRSENVSRMASRVAAVPAVRAALLDLQRSFRKPPGTVADGRDMGTVVFPDATIKVFLDASVAERARRRYKQLKRKGESVNFARLFQDLESRDRRDRERAVSPTVPARDAVIIDTTHLDLETVVGRVLDLVNERLGDRKAY